MLSEIRALGSEQVQGRREYPIAGGRVLYVPAYTSPAWRAVNAMGVLLGAFATYEQAEAAVRENTPAGGARTPPPRTRCSTCRGRHATKDCPEMPGKKGDEHGKQGSGSSAPRGRGGRGPGPEASGAARRGDGGHEDLRHGRVEHREDDAVRAADVGGTVPRGGADVGGTVPRGGAVTSDPHSLDDYYEALASLSAQKAVRVRYLTWKVWGGSRVNSHSDTVEHALEELVAQGRADRDLSGKYRARPESALETPGVRVNGVQLTSREIDVEVTDDSRPRLDGAGFTGAVAGRQVAAEPTPPLQGCGEVTSGAADPDPCVDAVNRAAGAVVRAILGTSEYPDAIIAEAEVFARRAARALEVARTELKRAEAAEKAAVKAREEAGRTTLAAMQRVERLERIAGATE